MNKTNNNYPLTIDSLEQMSKSLCRRHLMSIDKQGFFTFLRTFVGLPKRKKRSELSVQEEQKKRAFIQATDFISG